MFNPDFHETEEAAWLVYNLGRLSFEWNMVEQFFTALIWRFLGNDQLGMAVTGGLGNQSRADILLALAKQHKGSQELLESTEFSCKAFNIIRENRNFLIHSHSLVPSEAGKPEWRRATDRGPKGHLSTLADQHDLELLIAQTCQLGLFAVDLMPCVKPFRRGMETPRLPAKFPPPSKLTQLAPEGRAAPKHRRKPSQRTPEQGP